MHTRHPHAITVKGRTVRRPLPGSTVAAYRHSGEFLTEGTITYPDSDRPDEGVVNDVVVNPYIVHIAAPPTTQYETLDIPIDPFEEIEF